MRGDLTIGGTFPDLRLPETTGTELALSEIAPAQPLVLAFVRGWWCPKEQVRLRGLVEMQEEIQRVISFQEEVGLEPYAIDPRLNPRPEPADTTAMLGTTIPVGAPR
mgnify:CR=1 FL=1